MTPFALEDWPEFGPHVVPGGTDAPAPPAPSEQQAERPPSPSAPRPARSHGKRSAYREGCRCDACRKANNAYHLARRAARSGAVPASAHGKASTYTNYLCRCAACRKAWAAYHSAYRYNRSSDEAVAAS